MRNFIWKIRFSGFFLVPKRLESLKGSFEMFFNVFTLNFFLNLKIFLVTCYKFEIEILKNYFRY